LKKYDRRNLGKIMIIVIRAGCVLKGYMRTNFKAENFDKLKTLAFLSVETVSSNNPVFANLI